MKRIYFFIALALLSIRLSAQPYKDITFNKGLITYKYHYSSNDEFYANHVGIVSCSKEYEGDYTAPEMIFVPDDWTWSRYADLEYVEQSAFKNCTGLTSVTFYYYSNILDFAFYGCTNLKTFKINNELDQKNAARASSERMFTPPWFHTQIGWRAFEGCTSLTWVEISSSITFIDGSVFKGCTNLRTIVMKGNPTPPSMTDSSLDGLNVDAVTLYVPKGCVEAYKKSDWGLFKNIVDTPPTFVEDATTDATRIYSRDGKIVVESLNENAKAYAFNSAGILIHTLTPVQGRAELSVPAGIYVVRYGNKTVKVMVK
ncbi:MAG: leucine-rich repeat domain-containing protein [Bacteroidaceae bacterium]